jgi:hypothetical protein
MSGLEPGEAGRSASRPLAGDAARRERTELQPLLRNGCSTVHARAVGARDDPIQGRVDLGDGVQQGAERVIATGSGFDATVSARTTSRRWRQSSRWDSSRPRKGSQVTLGAGKAVVAVVESVDMGVLQEWARTRPAKAEREGGARRAGACDLGGSGERRCPVPTAPQHVQAAKATGAQAHRQCEHLPAGQRERVPPGSPGGERGGGHGAAGGNSGACCHRRGTSLVVVTRVGRLGQGFAYATGGDRPPGMRHASRPRATVLRWSRTRACPSAVVRSKAVAGQPEPAHLADDQQCATESGAASSRSRLLAAAPRVQVSRT